MVFKPISNVTKLYPRRPTDFPNKLVFYRQGVSDSQLSAVLEHEVEAVCDACAHIRV